MKHQMRALWESWRRISDPDVISSEQYRRNAQNLGAIVESARVVNAQITTQQTFTQNREDLLAAPWTSYGEFKGGISSAAANELTTGAVALGQHIEVSEVPQQLPEGVADFAA